VDIVKFTQKQNLNGSEGGWKDYLVHHDKKLGSSIGDPAKRAPEFLVAFLRTFPLHLQKVLTNYNTMLSAKLSVCLMA
jgi:hypothetical protein